MGRRIKLSTITNLFRISNTLEKRSEKRRKEATELKRRYTEQVRKKS